MKAHKRKKYYILNNYKINILLSSMVGILSILITTCLGAILVSNADVSLGIISIINILCLGIGSFVSGYLASIKRLKKGIISGTLCGLIIFTVLLLTGFILNIKFNMYSKICKLIVSVVCSIIGAVKSSNTHIA